jgi:hypothetical protein
MPEPLHPPQPYPYEGCCEHVPNAHARDHCLLCDCERAPKVVNPTQAREPITTPLPVARPDGEAATDPEIEVVFLDPCGLCGAVTVTPQDRDRHAAWHERSVNTIEHLTSALAAIVGGLGSLKTLVKPTPKTPED